MRVKIYRNLNKSCWSVMNAKTSRVIDHRQSLAIKNAKFIVHPSGRERVLRERRKNVHAFITGELVDNLPLDSIQGPSELVSYNPYLMASFYNKQTKEPINVADLVTFNDREVCAYGAKNV